MASPRGASLLAEEETIHERRNRIDVRSVCDDAAECAGERDEQESCGTGEIREACSGNALAERVEHAEELHVAQPWKKLFSLKPLGDVEDGEYPEEREGGARKGCVEFDHARR